MMFSPDLLARAEKLLASSRLQGLRIATAESCTGGLIPLTHISLLAFGLAFALFRLFDIWKPWPVSWADQNLKGGLGVMTDDMIAGGMAGALVVAARLVFHI